MAIRIDRVVTKGGDSGRTALGDGSRVGKDSPRIEALGAVDEANACIGVLRCLLPPDSPPAGMLRRIQNGLFDMGGDLCLPGDGPRFRLGGGLLATLEQEIAALGARQRPLDSFVLPGGTPAAAQAHMVRTVVRRAERRVVALAEGEPVNPLIGRTLNRLSDYAFVLARHLNADGADDVLWEREAPKNTNDRG